MIIDSLSSDLFNNQNTKTFDLVLSDTIGFKVIHVHRLILQISSKYFENKLRGENYLYYVLHLPPGTLDIMYVLIEYMYFRNFQPIRIQSLENLEKLKAVCDLLEMEELYKKIDNFLKCTINQNKHIRTIPSKRLTRSYFEKYTRTRRYL